MADESRNFDINIRTKADTAGGKPAEDQLDRIKAKEEQWKRTQAEIAARKVEGGTPPTPPIESLSGLAGPALVGVAAIGVGIKQLYSTLKEASEFQEKLSRNIADQVDQLGKLSTAWSEASINARTYGDTAQLLGRITKELDNVAEHTRQLNNVQVTLWQNLQEGALTAIRLTSGLPGIWTPYTDALNQALEDQKKVAANALAMGSTMAAAGERSRLAWEALKLEPIDQAVTEATANLEAYKSVLASTDTTTEEGIGLAGFYTRRVIELDAQLKILTQTQKESARATEQKAAADAKAAEQAAKLARAELEKRVPGLSGEQPIKEADAQTQRILQNEQAAAAARSEGREKDAEMFQRSADQYKASATPKQLEDLKRIHDLQDKLKPVGPEAAPFVQPVEQGSGGPSLVGAAAERQRREGIEDTRRASEQATRDREESLRTQRREQTAPQAGTGDKSLGDLVGLMRQLLQKWS